MAGEATRTQGIGRTVRLIAELLAGKAHTRATAAKLLGIRAPAAARQLDAIEAHLPGIVVEDTRGGRRYSFRRADGGKPVSLGAAIAACFGASIAPLFEGTRYAIDMQDATRRVVEQATRASDFGDVDRKFLFHARGGEVALSGGSGLLDDLIEAVLRCRWVRITYQRFESDVEQLDIRPVSLLVYEHQLYVMGLDESGDAHPYRFSRLRRVETSAAGFEYPGRNEYDPARLLRDSIGIFVDPSMLIADVSVKLAPRWRAYAATHRWHASQRCEPCPDGSTVVHLRVRLCRELERWVLAFGEDAEVLAPAEFRGLICRRLAAARATYADEDP